MFATQRKKQPQIKVTTSSGCFITNFNVKKQNKKAQTFSVLLISSARSFNQSSLSMKCWVYDIDVRGYLSPLPALLPLSLCPLRPMAQQEFVSLKA